MIRAGQDYVAKLSTGECHVIVSDNKGLAIFGRAIIAPAKSEQTKDYMDTICHECCHLIFPDASEAEVARIAGDITEVLWKRGYRLPKQRKPVDKD